MGTLVGLNIIGVLAGVSQEIGRFLADVLGFLPPPLVVVLLSMAPILELRGAIPLGIAYYGLDWRVVFALAVLSNTLVVPFIWWLLEPIERFLRKSEKLDRGLTKLYDRTRHRSRKRIETYEEIALFFFVAVPLPGTGAWTGALITYLFDLPRRKSYAIIFVGVLVAGALTTTLTLAGVGIFDLLTGDA